jgi:hypothetical protein
MLAIKSRAKLSEAEYGNFIEVLCMNRARVPTTRKAIEYCLRHIVRAAEHAPLDDLPDSIRSLAMSKGAGPNPTMQQLIDHGIIEVSIDPHRSLWLLPQYIHSLSATIATMKSRSFLHNETKTPFLTSDNPVLIYRRMEGGIIVPYPWKVVSDFCIYFPLSPKVAFFYDSREEPRAQHRRVFSEKTVHKLNRLAIGFADRFVIGSEAHKRLYSDFAQNLSPVPDIDNCEVGPERVIRLEFKFGEAIQMKPWKYDFPLTPCPC